MNESFSVNTSDIGLDDMSFASHSSKNNIFAELKWLKQIDELLID